MDTATVSQTPSPQPSEQNSSRTHSPSQNTIKSAPKNATASKKTKQASDREARLARKLERAMDLDHLVVWLRTTDAQVFRTMLYPLDRGCAKIRTVMASMEISLAQGQEILESVQEYVTQIESATRSGLQLDLQTQWNPAWAAQSAPLSIQEKQMLRAYRKAIASQPGVDFYLPHSFEGKRFLEAIIALDSRLVQARATELLDENTRLLQTVGSLIRRGHEIVTDLVAVTHVQYEQHPLVKRMLKADQQRTAVLK